MSARRLEVCIIVAIAAATACTGNTVSPRDVRACDADEHRCDGTCVLDVDPTTCGSNCEPCVAPENATATCDGASCGFACNSGFHRCGDACVSNTDPATCGSSCEACVPPENAIATCDGTSCGLSCKLGFHRCGDACVSSTAPESCGGSCKPCPAPLHATATCRGITCGFACNAGFHRCDDECVSDDDANHCGCERCTPPENGSPICTNAGCDFVCDEGFDRCGDRCVTTWNDPSACGPECHACPSPAHASATCDRSGCGFACESGFTRCGAQCCELRELLTRSVVLGPEGQSPETGKVAFTVEPVGTPHLAHIEFDEIDGHRIVHALFDGTDWISESIELGDSDWSFSGLSIALDASARAHVAFIGHRARLPRTSIWHVAFVETSSIVEMVATFDSIEDATSTEIAIAGDGIVHIASEGVGLGYVKRNGSSWEFAPRVASMRPGSRSRMVLDSANRPHVAFVEPRYDAKLHAYIERSEWNIETVTATVGRGYASRADMNRIADFDLDREDRGHLLFSMPERASRSSDRVTTRDQIRYARSIQGGWILEPLDEALVGCSRARMAIDDMRDIHAVCLDADDANLRYVHADSGHREADARLWSATSLAGVPIASFFGDVEREVEFAIDALGRGHVIYRTNEPNGLVYATFPLAE